MFGAYLAGRVVRWAGSPSGLIGMEYTHRAMAFPGDILICRGKIRGPSKKAAQSYSDCQVGVENQDGLPLVEGQATVRLV